MIIHPLGEKTGVYLIENFLTAQECSLLIRVAKQRGMSKNIFYNPAIDTYNDTSQVIRLEDEATPTVAAIHQKIEKLTRFPKENGEIFKIMHYDVGGNFSNHNDFIPHDKNSPYDKSKPPTGRLAQMLFYLNDVEEGGETLFTELGIKIVPKRGRALLWYGVHGMYLPEKGDKKIYMPRSQKRNPYAIHCAQPILKGEKWIGAKFLHDRPVTNNPPGKRTKSGSRHV